jgi:pimeloyl-ACP methyl ester carboxylesterase
MKERISIPRDKGKLTGDLVEITVEGDEDAHSTVVFVHDAFGRHEDEFLEDGSSHSYFNDLAVALTGFHVVWFRFANEVGEKQKEMNLATQTTDLELVLRYVGDRFPRGKIAVLAHSLGAFVTAMLCPKNVHKVVCTSIPAPDANEVMKTLGEIIQAKHGGVWDPESVSLYPRGNGTVQKIGPSFWWTLAAFRPVAALAKLAEEVPVFIIHPLQDSEVNDDEMRAYHNISGVTPMSMEGGHNFSGKDDRESLLSVLQHLLLPRTRE